MSDFFGWIKAAFWIAIIVGLGIPLLMFVIGRWLKSQGYKPVQRYHPSESDKTQDILEELEPYWDERDAGGYSVPAWHADEPTDRQLAKLEDLGYEFTGDEITKGEASDIIGFHAEPEPEDIEKLRFFKVPKKDYRNQTLARINLLKIFSDPENVEKWSNRPASPYQKEVIRVFKSAAPKGITHPEAQKLIDGIGLGSDELLREVTSLEMVMKEIFDPEVRRDFGIKKPTLTSLRAAVEKLHDAKGCYRFDVDDLVDQLVRDDPDLEKN